jgi:ABC-2 type transport system permease protein
MRKVMVVAAREYQAAVRTKSFLISLIIMPILMFGSIGVQMLLKDKVDTRPKRFAVVDRSPGQTLAHAIEAAAQKRNETAIRDPKTGQPKGPPYLIERVEPSAEDAGAVGRQRFELSERIRQGELFGVVEIGPDIFEPLPSPSPRAPGEPPERSALRYQTNTPTYMEFPNWLEGVVNEAVRDHRLAAAKIPVATLMASLQPVSILNRGLTRHDASAGGFTEAPTKSPMAAILMPLALSMMMYMMILVGSTPLMQGVLEEKTQRIAEVLLGSIHPFDLMLGKLIGMVGVSLTILAVYLTGGYWAAQHFGYADDVSPSLLAWFIAFQALAVLMFGALFIAVGAACTDAKESQSMLLPVMMLVIVPMFLLGHVLTEPNSPLSTVASLIPFATPILMVTRMGVPPGVPLWQPVLGIFLVLLTTLASVYAAGRIFRVGLLMQGKGARFADLARWVVRG